MTEPLSPVELIEARELCQKLETSDLLLIDTCKTATYQQIHIPGAIHVPPSEMVSGIQPAAGKLPDIEQLKAMFRRIGYSPDKNIVVYDDEGGGWAGRMIWTLDLIGHKKMAYLNGGLHAWLHQQLPAQQAPCEPRPSEVDIQITNPSVRATAEDIMSELDNGITIWDARSPEEYDGSRQFAARAGHIPGAINFEWTRGMDAEKSFCIRSDLAEQLRQLGLGPEKNIITHCQSHHRSGFTYLAARILGYPAIRAYDGSWSEWGNRADTPVELT